MPFQFPGTEPAVLLSSAQRETFARTGCLVLPGFLSSALVERLRPEVDRWVDEGLRARSMACGLDKNHSGPPPVLELELPAHAELLTWPPLLRALAELIGPSFVVRHLHSDRHVPGVVGKAWHHDGEPNSANDPGLLMVRALHYLEGLDESVGSLVVLPGSHREPAARTARAHLGTAILPGEVVLDRLPAGSTVLMHSALFHARRPAPVSGAGPGRRRYLVDASYCQTGARWRPAQPHWRYMLARARELELGGGLWPELFAEQHFSEFRRG